VKPADHQTPPDAPLTAGPDPPPHRAAARPADLVELQRARILAAAVHAIDEGGLTHLTVARVIAGAHVSRTTFYEIFNDTEDCVHAAMTQILTDASLAMRDAHAAEREPLAGVRAAMTAMLERAEQHPAAARLCFVEALAGGPRILRARGQALEEAASAIDRTLSGSALTELPSPISARAAVGAVAEMLHARLLRGQGRSLLELKGPLMAVIVLPYLGRDAAQRELSRSTPRPSPSPSVKQRTDPLADLGFRLTYRTPRSPTPARHRSCCAAWRASGCWRTAARGTPAASRTPGG
jgi:AcrR family transcriptional regulator